MRARAVPNQLNARVFVGVDVLQHALKRRPGTTSRDDDTYDNAALRLADAMHALDEWLRTGGTLPDAWELVADREICMECGQIERG